MSFDLDVSPTFQATVQITVPGKPSRPLKVTFKHMDSDQLAEFNVAAPARTNLVNAQEIVSSVDDKPEGMTDEQFLTTLFKRYPASARDLYNTFQRELTESRVKNF